MNSETIQIDGAEVTIRTSVSGTHPHFGSRSRQRVYTAVIGGRAVSEGHLTRKGAIEGARLYIERHQGAET